MSIVFENRIDAGRQLAERLLDLRGVPDVIVLALPRGGVPVAAEVARELGAPLDVLLVRKIGVPARPELAMGAIASGDQMVLDTQIIADFSVTEDDLQQVISAEREVLQQREQRYRGDREPLDVHGQTVVIVDDGLATGSTMLVAIRAAKQMHPAGLVVAVPVGSPDRIAKISAEVSRVECVSMPQRFMAVGQWYHDFSATTDDEVVATLTPP